MDIPRLRRSVLRWFRRSRRPLPWRRSKDPYAIWISEVMLQQTTVATVIPFYERFMATFPTVRALAASREDAVLAIWSGLGYYSRARNLRRAARHLVARHAGVFPRDVETAMTLEGVGRYTASAVTSIAFGTRAAVVDGNVRRVLSRVFATRNLSEARTRELATRLLSARAPGTWNEAMMELGATVCTPTRPRCSSCPIAPDCRGQARARYWSARKGRPSAIRVRVDMALVEDQGRVLLIRNPKSGLLAGLLELPHVGLPRQGAASDSLQQRYGVCLDLAPTAEFAVRHVVTEHRIEARIFRGRRTARTKGLGARFHSIARAGDLPLGGLTRKALRAAGLLGT